MKINEIRKDVKLKVIERTNSGIRFIDIIGKILKIEEPFIYIKNYVINRDDIIKYEEK